MLKKILKIIGACVFMYPIGLIMVTLDRGNAKYHWLLILVLDVIACVGMILYEIFGKKK